MISECNDKKYCFILNLLRLGGLGERGDLPARHLKELEPKKIHLVTFFPKIYLGIIYYSKSLYTKFDVTMATTL